jgi:hypothetical protein
MELVNYKIYKDDTLIYENQCPVLFFIGVIPVNVSGLYDYIEITYQGNVLIYNANAITRKWKL